MLVVDACVALAWVLDDTEENHRYSGAVAEAKIKAGRPLIGPQVLLGECAHVLLRVGRSAQWGAVLIAEKAEIITTIGVALYGDDRSLADLTRFALQHGVQGFDALYLSLAMRTGAELATIDKGLRSAALAAGVKVFAP